MLFHIFSHNVTAVTNVKVLKHELNICGTFFNSHKSDLCFNLLCRATFPRITRSALRLSIHCRVINGPPF